MTDDLRALTAELRAVNGQLKVVTDRLNTMDKRQRRHKAGTIVLSLVVVAVCVLGVSVYQLVLDQEQRACESRRVIAEAIIAAAGNPGGTPEEQERRAEQIETFRRDVAAGCR